MTRGLRKIGIALGCLLCYATTSFVVFAQHQEETTSWQQDEIIVNHPIESVLPIILDCQTYDQLFPYIRNSKRLSLNQCYVESRILSETFWMRLRLETSVSQDKRVVKIGARKTEGNVKVFELETRLDALSDNTRTRITIRMQANPGIPGVPDSLIQKFVKKVIHKTLVNFQVRLLLGRY